LRAHDDELKLEIKGSEELEEFLVRMILLRHNGLQIGICSVR
jgi:hypothetical protein